MDIKSFLGDSNMQTDLRTMAFEPCYSKCGPQSSSSTSPRSFLVMQNLRPTSDLLNHNLCALTNSPGDSYAHSK